MIAVKFCRAIDLSHELVCRESERERPKGSFVSRVRAQLVTALGVLCVLLAPTYADAQSVQLANSWTTGLTHNVGAGSNRLLIYVVTIESAGGDVTAVTYGGQAMTQGASSQCLHRRR